jgi:hypothetical protein
VDEKTTSGDTATKARLVRMLRDPDGYFDQARREAREQAKRFLSERLDGHPEPAH